ncbi:MAG: AtpZ/AtpI family protein [Candidatus Jordarchaeaceae archaeon]
MSLGRDKKDSRRYSVGNIGKWLAIGSELPIMILAGVFIGYYVGEEFGPPFSTFSLILGAAFGFLVGTYNIIKIVKIWEKREISERVGGGKQIRAPSSSEESLVIGKSSPEKGSELSDEEKFERVLRLLKLQAGLLDEESSPSRNDSEFEE